MGAALKYSGLSVLSGRTTGRYRLNRGGHRQANAALYRAVIVGMRFHQPTRDYVARRTADGRTKREIILQKTWCISTRELSCPLCRSESRV